MRFLCSLLVFTLVVFPACGPQNANVTPQAAVAHYGSDILTGINTYQAFLVKVTEGPMPVLSVEAAKPRMDEIRKGLTEAQKLSELLKRYDALSTLAEKKTIIGQIQASLSALSALGLDAATLPAQIVAEGTKIVGNINSLIASTRAAVAAGGM